MPSSHPALTSHPVSTAHTNESQRQQNVTTPITITTNTTAYRNPSMNVNSKQGGTESRESHNGSPHTCHYRTKGRVCRCALRF